MTSQTMQTRLEVDLNDLISDGTGDEPGGTTYTRLPDESMLTLLTRAFNNDAANVQYWGFEIQFVGSLSPGFSYWTHPTQGGGTMIPEIFGSPRGIRYRSGPDFLRHVKEILFANEKTLRNCMHAIHPNNVRNNNCIIGLKFREISCSCRRGSTAL